MAAQAMQKTSSAKKTTQWLWEAKTKAGEIKKGEMEALGRRGRQRAPQVPRPQPRQGQEEAARRSTSPALGGGVTGKDILIFTRQFATMIDAGLPLVQCLDILGSQMDNPAFKKVVFAIKAKVEQGSTFADALKEHPKVFDELFVQLCAAGEVGGILDTILNRLAAYREKNEKLKRKVKGAMTYPVIVICVAIGVTALLLLKVTPVFAKMFGDFGSALPAPTQFVVDLSEWLQNWIIHLVRRHRRGGLRLRRAFYRNPKGRKIWDKVILKMPLFGDVLRKVAVARFTRTLGTMISSGVPILDALDVTAKTAGNRTVEDAIYYRARQDRRR